VFALSIRRFAQIVFYPQIPQINADYFLGGQFGEGGFFADGFA
jgi:hypothetical protein